MSGTTPYARPLKPAGGIEAVWLIPASDIVSATYGDGLLHRADAASGGIGRSMADPGTVLVVPGREPESGRTSALPPYAHAGSPIPKKSGTASANDSSHGSATEGTVARIETASGVFLLAGRSEKFGAEQPLRLTEIRYESQTKFAARPVLVLTLAGEDTAPAPPIREQ